MAKTNTMRHKLFLIIALLATSSAMAEKDPTAPLDWQSVKQKPTAQKVVKNKTYRMPRLDSIVCQPQVPCVAILNSKVVEKNDIVNGYKIAKIDGERVTLNRDGRHWNLELFKLDLKQQ